MAAAVNSPVEIMGELWLAERQLPMRERAVDAILDYFLAELPEAARMANAGAVVDAVANDADTDPPKGVYVHYAKQLDFLVNMGLLQVHEDDEWTEEDEKGTTTPTKVYSLAEQAWLIYRSTNRKLGYE